MTGDPLVATLIAPMGGFLGEAEVKNFTDYLLPGGAELDRIDFSTSRQAADIFFNGAKPASRDWDFDVIIQPAATRRKKILIADMESTIIEQEMLDELAAEIGVGEQVAALTRRAMNGELDFAAALDARVRLLEGQPASLLEKVAGRMTLMPGAVDLVASMKRAGAQCWLVSGGFTFFVKIIAERLGFDRFFANQLMFEDGRLTGQVKPPVLDKNSKKTLLEKACADYGLKLSDTLAVGDGANDIPMLQRCNEGGGLGIAFHAKPHVRERIAAQINHGDLTALLYAQGFFFG